MTEEVLQPLDVTDLDSLNAVENIPAEYLNSLSKEVVLTSPLTSFEDESDNLFIGRYLTKDELIPYLLAQRAPDREIRTLHIHHTWSPTPSQWYGYSTLKGVADYYHNAYGYTWGKIPTFWIAQQQHDGPWGYWIATHPYYASIHCPKYNTNGYGVEVCWNGNLAPFTQEQMMLIAHLIKAVNVTYGVSIQHSHRDEKTKSGIRIHRYDYNTDCPGNKNEDSLVDNAIKLLQVTKTVHKGDKGEEVGWLQQNLQVVGYRLDVTYNFDNRTEALVKSFQASRLLDSTGIADEATWGAFAKEDRMLQWQDNYMVGLDVTWVRRILQRIGYYKEEIEDIYAPSKFDGKLHDAVGRFQKDCAVVNDGIVGPITWKLLRYWSN